MLNRLLSLSVAFLYFVAVDSGYIKRFANPACECILFKSGFRSQGVFTSPNFEISQERTEFSSDCFIYSFVGQRNEIVELQFVHPLGKYGFEHCTEVIKIFLDLEKAEVNEESVWNYDLCNRSIEKPPVAIKYYSSFNNLLVEYHPLRTNRSGFKGKFKFHQMSKFEMTGGIKRSGVTCAYDFHSSATNVKGHFFSPRYPRNYPPSSNCMYVFYAQEKQVVMLTFHKVRLESSSHSCLEAADFVVIREGDNPSGQVIGHLCHDDNERVFLSSGRRAYVDFMADRANQSQGFHARFEFVDLQKLQTILIRPYSAPANLCIQNFTSIKIKSGLFTLHLGLHGGGQETKTCRYLFQGVGKERVQVAFLHIDHLTTNETTSSCDQEDSITVTTFIKGLPTDLGTFCSKVKLPHQFMSTDSRLEITYVGHLPTTGVGFKARYRFVTDFGIRDGRQIDDVVCGFTFNSKQLKNGSFSSPNFPGLYPRSTECHYFFFAEPEELVNIQFSFLDLNGNPSKCTEDYVEFSNFNVPYAERETIRFCGLNGIFAVPPSITSEENFFRATFRSDDQQDAIGFRASYHFHQQTASQRYTQRTATSGSCEGTFPLIVLYPMHLILSSTA